MSDQATRDRPAITWRLKVNGYQCAFVAPRRKLHLRNEPDKPVTLCGRFAFLAAEPQDHSKGVCADCWREYRKVAGR